MNNVDKCNAKKKKKKKLQMVLFYHLSQTQEPAPDGHRAPVMELLTTGPETRSIDTQTPSGNATD